MKRVLSIILAFTLTLGLLPFAALAAVDPKDQEFQNYLQEIGMSEEDFVAYLTHWHDYSLEEFEDLEDLIEYLGPVLDEENLQELLAEYGMTEEEFNQFLEETDTTLDEFVFYEDLYFSVSEWLYTEEMTPITDENLQTLLETYEFGSIEELEAFLNSYDDSIENYEYIEELEFAIAEHYFMEAKDDLINTLDSFGLSLAEANKLANHVVSILENPDLDPEQFFTALEGYGARLMDFPEFDSASELSAEDIAEFIDIWDGMLTLLDLKVEYYLVKDGVTTPVSFASLMQMNSTNGADLMIKIYSTNGDLLADMVITKEMFDSEFIEETGENIEDTTDAAEEVKKAADEVAKAEKKAPAAKAPAKTVKGGKLPNTASDYLQNTMAGLAMILLGAIVFRKVKATRA
ncbi:processed acidic surface protein [Mesobacillus subterraneus]|uniref:processed acidic surface protein n=1 Tax=Mesobacillus subterraneus TaxID=285983 RepID=UPI001CFD1BC4|nr:processed acidic surface protein [Mesobacillus subterraneus]WLR55438.1 processed acidic surface protein [Mesobacillus subterraneus]